MFGSEPRIPSEMLDMRGPVLIPEPDEVDQYMIAGKEVRADSRLVDLRNAASALGLSISGARAPPHSRFFLEEKPSSAEASSALFSITVAGSYFASKEGACLPARWPRVVSSGPALLKRVQLPAAKLHLSPNPAAGANELICLPACLAEANPFSRLPLRADLGAKTDQTCHRSACIQGSRGIILLAVSHSCKQAGIHFVADLPFP